MKKICALLTSLLLIMTFTLPAAAWSNPFTDVPAGSYYGPAIAWAYSKGITTGTSKAAFSPDAPCTRAQIITFLYRYFNQK